MKRAARASGAIAAVCLLAATACSSDGDETTSESASTAAPATAAEESVDEPTSTEPPETAPSTDARTTDAPATTEPETEEPAVTAPSDDGGASVIVVLTDPFGPAGTPGQFAVEPDPISVDAGSVEIVVENQGGDVHNLLIVKGDDPAALPVNEDGAVIEADLPEDEFIGKIATVDAGTEESASFDLDAGSYILFCNIVTMLTPPESHFALGMVSTFTVI